MANRQNIKVFVGLSGLVVTIEGQEPVEVMAWAEGSRVTIEQEAEKPLAGLPYRNESGSMSDDHCG